MNSDNEDLVLNSDDEYLQIMNSRLYRRPNLSDNLENDTNHHQQTQPNRFSNINRRILGLDNSFDFGSDEEEIVEEIVEGTSDNKRFNIPYVVSDESNSGNPVINNSKISYKDTDVLSDFDVVENVEDSEKDLYDDPIVSLDNAEKKFDK